MAKSRSRARRRSVQADASAAAALAAAAAAATEEDGQEEGGGHGEQVDAAGEGEWVGEGAGESKEAEGEGGGEGEGEELRDGSTAAGTGAGTGTGTGAEKEGEGEGGGGAASGAGAESGADAGAEETKTEDEDEDATGTGIDAEAEKESESEKARKTRELLTSGPVPPEPPRARARTDPATLPSADVPLGGVVFAELLTRPGEGKSVKRWHMHRTTALAIGVERRPHPNEGQGMAAAARLYVKMPDALLVPEDLRVCYRDTGLKQWVEEEDCGPSFDQDVRELAFKTTRLAAMALVVPRVADLPYKGWSARPVAPRALGAEMGESASGSAMRGATASRSACLFCLETARLTLQVLLQGAYCVLVGPRVRELGHLLHRPLRPAALADALWTAGVLVRPAMEDADRPGLQCDASGLAPVAKVPQLEEACAATIATCSAAFEVRWSRWNQRPLGPRSAECEKGAGAIYPRWPAGEREAAAQHSAVLRCRELMTPPGATVGDPEPLAEIDPDTLPFVAYGSKESKLGEASPSGAGESEDVSGSGSGSSGIGGRPLQRGSDVLRESAPQYDAPDEGHPTDWRTAVGAVDEDSAAGVRWWLCSSLEGSPAFDPNPTPGGETHTALLRALAPRASSEAVAVA